MVPSAFEFPASRNTFHELGSSSLEEMKDVRFGCWGDGARIGKGRRTNERLVRYNRAVGERNFQSEGDRYKENVTLSMHYMMCKGRRESLVHNHIMGTVQKMGNVG